MSSEFIPQIAPEPAQITKRRSVAEGRESGAVTGTVEKPRQQEPFKSSSTVNPEALDGVVKDINDYVQTVQRDLQFSIDEKSGRTVIKVFDSGNDRLIREIPSEEILELANDLSQLTEGVLLKVQA